MTCDRLIGNIYCIVVVAEWPSTGCTSQVSWVRQLSAFAHSQFCLLQGKKVAFKLKLIFVHQSYVKVTSKVGWFVFVKL